MLSALRTAAGTWVAKLLLILLVLSFAVWGISGQVVNGLGNNAVVTAGGTTVTPREYRLAYDRQLALMSQQFGQRLTREQARTLGIEDQVLAQIAAGAVLDEQASRLGLGVSEENLGDLIRADPTFQGADGRFNRQQFDYVLRQIGINLQDYADIRSQDEMRQQLIQAVSEGFAAPDTFLRAVALYQGEDRTAEYLLLPKSLVEPIEEPADAALTGYFEQNRQTYAAPEYRKLAYVSLLPETILDEASITDQQVKDDYDRNVGRFTTPETRTIEQLVFPDREAAQTALDSIRAGATFDSVVTAQGKTQADTLLGTFPKDQLPDPAIAEAAFSLQAAEVSQVIDGAFGAVLVRVTEISPEVVRTLADVTPDIRRQLALAEATRVLTDVRDGYEDSRAAGDTMREAAAKLGLTVTSIDAIDRMALRPDGSVVNDLPQSRELIEAAFSAETGMENPAVNVGNAGYVFYEVEEIVPSRDRTLDEVRARVVADWKAAEAVSRLGTKAVDAEKRLRDGTATLDALATELGLQKETKRGLKRQADDGDFGRAGVAAVFGVAEGGSGLVSAPSDDAQIVFKVTEVFEPAGADASTVAEESRTRFASGMSNDLLDQLVAKLQAEYGVEVNAAAIEQALAF